MLEPMVDATEPSAPSVRRLSRAEYDRMVELGMFADERIELLRGALVQMSPQKWPHATAVAWFNEELIRSLDRSYEVRPQLPFAADDYSEPEPDLAVAYKDYTRRDHPSAVLLLIEIADSSLRIDRGLKLEIYAAAGVPEYWIVDVATMAVTVHTEPRDGRYERIATLRDGDTLRPTLLPTVALAISAIPR